MTLAINGEDQLFIQVQEAKKNPRLNPGFKIIKCVNSEIRMVCHTLSLLKPHPGCQVLQDEKVSEFLMTVRDHPQLFSASALMCLQEFLMAFLLSING